MEKDTYKQVPKKILGSKTKNFRSSDDKDQIRASDNFMVIKLILKCYGTKKTTFNCYIYCFITQISWWCKLEAGANYMYNSRRRANQRDFQLLKIINNEACRACSHCLSHELRASKIMVYLKHINNIIFLSYNSIHQSFGFRMSHCLTRWNRRWLVFIGFP